VTVGGSGLCFWRLGFWSGGAVHRDEFGDRDKFVAFGLEGIEGGGHGVDGGRVDVVGEDDRAGRGIFDDVARKMFGFADFPVLGIDRPEDDAEAVFVVEAFGELRVAPSVVGDFMAFVDDAFGEGWIDWPRRRASRGFREARTIGVGSTPAFNS
jgi:hypothetical protein